MLLYKTFILHGLRMATKLCNMFCTRLLAYVCLQSKPELVSCGICQDSAFQAIDVCHVSKASQAMSRAKDEAEDFRAAIGASASSSRTDAQVATSVID